MIYYVVKIEDTHEPYGIQYLEQFIYDHNSRQLIPQFDLKPQLYLHEVDAMEGAKDVRECRSDAAIKVTVCRCDIIQTTGTTLTECVDKCDAEMRADFERIAKKIAEKIETLKTADSHK